MNSIKEPEFPTFKCMISDTDESYDSVVEYFFFMKNLIAADLARLRISDREWGGNYVKMMRYLQELAESLVVVTPPPSHQFLVDISRSTHTDEDNIEILLRTESLVVADLVEASNRIRELIFWYIRIGRDPKFAKSFNPARFEGLPLLRTALETRSIYLSQRK